MVDIVVAAAVAVAFGVVFLAWNALCAATAPLFAFLPPAQAIIYGVWLLPAVLVGLIVRRPGAALFGGLVSAAVSVLLGSPYGADALDLGRDPGRRRGARLRASVCTGAGRCRSPSWRAALPALAAAIHDVARLLPGRRCRLLARVRRRIGRQRRAGRRHRRMAAASARWSRTGVLRDFAVGREQREV